MVRECSLCELSLVRLSLINVCNGREERGLNVHRVVSLTNHGISPRRRQRLLKDAVNRMRVGLTQLCLRRFTQAVRLQRGLLLSVDCQGRALSLYFVYVIIGLRVGQARDVNCRNRSLVARHGARDVERVSYCRHVA